MADLFLFFSLFPPLSFSSFFLYFSLFSRILGRPWLPGRPACDAPATLAITQAVRCDASAMHLIMRNYKLPSLPLSTSKFYTTFTAPSTRWTWVKYLIYAKNYTLKSRLYMRVLWSDLGSFWSSFRCRKKSGVSGEKPAEIWIVNQVHISAGTLDSSVQSEGRYAALICFSQNKMIPSYHWHNMNKNIRYVTISFAHYMFAPPQYSAKTKQTSSVKHYKGPM